MSAISIASCIGSWFSLVGGSLAPELFSLGGGMWWWWVCVFVGVGARRVGVGVGITHEATHETNFLPGIGPTLGCNF